MCTCWFQFSPPPALISVAHSGRDIDMIDSQGMARRFSSARPPPVLSQSYHKEGHLDT